MRNPGAHGGVREPAPAEPLQPVPQAERLADALEPLRKHPDQLTAAQQPLRLGGIGWHMPAPPGQVAEHRQRVHQVGAEHPQVAMGRMLVEHTYLEHERVQWDHARVVGYHQGGAGRRHVMHAAHPHPEPAPVERTGGGHHHGAVELRVEAGLRIHLVVAGHPAPHEVGRAADPPDPSACPFAGSLSG